MEETARELEQSIKQLKGVAADVMHSDDPSAEVAREDKEEAKAASDMFDEFKI